MANPSVSDVTRTLLVRRPGTHFRAEVLVLGALTLVFAACGGGSSDDDGGGAAGSGGANQGGAAGSGASGGSSASGAASGAASGGATGGAAGSTGSAGSGGAGGTAGSSGGTSGNGAGAGGASDLVDCDHRKVLCKVAEPSCGDLAVASVEGTCYGPCVPIEECACSAAEECPHEETFTCWMSAMHCGPYVK